MQLSGRKAPASVPERGDKIFLLAGGRRARNAKGVSTLG
jgi:hypothetical protein